MPAASLSTEADFKKLGQHLRDIRKEAGLTQANLAARLGLAQKWVSIYERGDMRLDLFQVGLILDALQCPRGELLRRVDHEWLKTWPMPESGTGGKPSGIREKVKASGVEMRAERTTRRRPRRRTAWPLRPGDRSCLESLVQSPGTPARLALRARIVLAAANGLSAREISEQTRSSLTTVQRWRTRYAEGGMESLLPPQVDTLTTAELAASFGVRGSATFVDYLRTLGLQPVHSGSKPLRWPSAKATSVLTDASGSWLRERRPVP